MKETKLVRYHELDGLRGLAALTVYFSHLIGVFKNDSTWFTRISFSPLHVFWHGEGAVKLFFILSGFVLTLPYIKNRDDINLPVFYVKRILRIYPVFIFTILFSLFLKNILFDSSHMSAYSEWINQFWKWNSFDLTFSELFKTLVLIGPSFNKDLIDPVIGTLRTEMGMSLLLPFMIFVALRTKMALNIIIPALFFFLNKDIFCMFYLGIVLGIYRIEILHYINRISKWNIILFFVISIVLYTGKFNFHNIFPETVNDGMEIIGASFFIILALRSGFFKNALNTSIVQFFGKISYSLYLLHFPILLVVAAQFNNHTYLIFPLSLLITIGVSYLTYSFIELFFIKVGRGVRLTNANNLVNKNFLGIYNYFVTKIVSVASRR